MKDVFAEARNTIEYWQEMHRLEKVINEHLASKLSIAREALKEISKASQIGDCFRIADKALVKLEEK